MPAGLDARHWSSLLWWLAVVAVGVQLKHHYSTATAADLEWMLRPLSILLEWYTGHEFHRDNNYEWVSERSDVRLVKSCAGINFMLMSFMVYAWVVRPDRRAEADLLPQIAGQTLLFCAAITASWATSLLANSLRIIVAMTVSVQEWKIGAVSIDAAELHRLIGMAVYVPLLSLQMMLGNRRNIREALWAPVLLYLLLMVVVPLITGNALQHPKLFIEHLLNVLLMIAVICGIYLLCHHRQRRKPHKMAETPSRKLEHETSPTI